MFSGGYLIRSKFGPDIFAVIIFLSTVTVYSFSFGVPFYFDDYLSILENPAVTNPDHLFTPDGFLFTMRYFGVLSFALDYHLWGQAPAGYHLVNIMLHSASTALLFFFVKEIQSDEIEGGDNSALLSACIASLLFAIHPLQTQTVIYISQRVTLLALFFYFVSLITYLGFRRSNSKNGYMLYVISLASSLIAYKSKEFAITIPLIIALIEFIIIKNEKSLRSLYSRLFIVAPYFILTAFIPIAIWGLSQHSQSSISAFWKSTKVLTSVGRWDFFCTELPIIIKYLGMFFWPSGLTIDHYAVTRSSFFDAPVIISSAVIGVMVLTGIIFLFNRKYSPRFRLIGFFILFLFIGFIVESGAVPIIDLMFEHRTYLPMAALCSIVGIAVARIFQIAKNKQKVLVAIIILVIIIPCIVISITRIGLWKDPAAFWKDVLIKNPRSYRADIALGTIAYENKFYDEAIIYFSSALKKTPKLSQIYYNLALAQEGKRDYRGAMVSYDQAISLDPRNDTFYLNRGVLYQKIGDPLQARDSMKKSIAYNPRSWLAYYNLGRVDLASGLLQEAIECFKQSIALGNKSPDAYVYWGESLRLLGRFDEAESRYSHVLESDPKNLLARSSLGMLQKQKRIRYDINTNRLTFPLEKNRPNSIKH